VEVLVVDYQVEVLHTDEVQVVLLRVAYARYLSASCVFLLDFLALSVGRQFLGSVKRHLEEALAGGWVPNMDGLVVASSYALEVRVQDNFLSHELVSEIRAVDNMAEFKSQMVLSLSGEHLAFVGIVE